MQDGFKYFVYCHLSVSVKESFQDYISYFFQWGGGKLPFCNTVGKGRELESLTVLVAKKRIINCRFIYATYGGGDSIPRGG